jgi:hypothetical protein
MADEKQRTTVSIHPPDGMPVAPYANATFTYVVTDTDVTVVFMRTPLIGEKRANEILARGEQILTGDFVGSITLPKTVAIDLGEQLKRLLGS